MLEIKSPKDQWKAARAIAKMDKNGDIKPLDWLKIPNSIIKKYFMTINKRG
ncbi:hypothetical protein [Fangia hongkongensis]|uniref:hypothetical protein n=1 Tax=Fangia hongkongensis TaxID=270495 RepID=UPI0003778DCA|nr:hypothetical protein [Fangia hongkongensis]MBK2126254.1 hypothetical protein [Fangia hongkongensis]